jgi:hypothetical protein
LTKKTCTNSPTESSEIAERERQVTQTAIGLRELFDSEAIYRFAAGAMLGQEQLLEDLEFHIETLRRIELAISILRTDVERLNDEQKLRAIQLLDDLGNNLAIEGLKHGVEITERRLKRLNSKGGRSRWENDPKTIEKRFVEDCWRGWQATPTRYISKAAFARDMLEKCSHLTSQKQIDDWCRAWSKPEAK